MSYTPTVWKSGDVVSSLKLNKLENGVAAAADGVDELNGEVSNVNDLLGIEEPSLDLVFYSLADNPNSPASIGLSPFVLSELDYGSAPYNITAIRLKITTAGTLTIGKVLKTNASVDVTYNADNFIVSEVLEFEETGVQTIQINPIKLTNEYYLFVGTPTDTAVFQYGGYNVGIEVGFLYHSGPTFIKGASAIGIDLYSQNSGVPANVRTAIGSVYEGKKLSILGDSISTFDGYIPEGNVTYYPSGTVTAVTDTWWKKLADALGLVLDVNNSWSGSYVTTANGETSAGCMSRCQNLGTPDVIIVWMGINDFNGEVALGTYDGSTALPATTTTFREAYAVMLNKILTAYQSAEVWVCTLPQCERNEETGFPEINGNGVALVEFNRAIKELAEAFGVKVLDHNACGLTYQNMPVYNPDNLHPNKFGHSLIANNDIWQMDNAVAKRYANS